MTMTEAGLDERPMTVEDVCSYLGVPKDFVYDQVRTTRLRASRIARQLRFRRADVDEFIEVSAVGADGS